MSDELLKDIENGDGVTLAKLARFMPRTRRDRPVSLGAVLRWVLVGALAPNGERVRLEAVRLGGRWITSANALRRFIERQTPRLDRPVATPRTSARRQRAADRADRELQAMGV